VAKKLPTIILPEKYQRHWGWISVIYGDVI
jgi:hypothetical protein